MKSKEHSYEFLELIGSEEKTDLAVKEIIESTALKSLRKKEVRQHYTTDWLRTVDDYLTNTKP